MRRKTKTCSGCKQEKLISEFCRQNDRKSGRRSACVDCERTRSKKWRGENKDKCNAAVRKWNLENPDKRRNAKLLRVFGITLNQYNEMFSEQQGCCAICGKHQVVLKLSLAVDHDHESGKIRQLLCNHCNLILGLVQDSIPLLQKFTNYVQKHKNI